MGPLNRENKSTIKNVFYRNILFYRIQLLAAGEVWAKSGENSLVSKKNLIP
jgi:hypothetical protein